MDRRPPVLVLAMAAQLKGTDEGEALRALT
jgi:hypothetical protein